MSKSEVRKRPRGKKQQEEWPSTPFYGILRHLCDEHEREVSALHRRIEDLEKNQASGQSDDSDESKIKAPDQPRTLPQPAPPKEDAAQLVLVHDPSAGAAASASSNSGEISAEREDTEPFKSMQLVTTKSTSSIRDASAVEKPAPSTQLLRQGPAKHTKQRPMSAGTWTTGRMSVPGFVEEFTGVSPSDSAAGSLHTFQVPQRSESGTPQRRTSGAPMKSYSGVLSKSPSGGALRSSGVLSKSPSGGALLLPQSGSFKVGSMASSSNDPVSNDEVLNRLCREDSVCSAASGESLRSDLPETGSAGMGRSESDLSGISGIQERSASKQSGLSGVSGSSNVKELAPKEEPQIKGSMLSIGQDRSQEEESPQLSLKAADERSPTNERKRKVGGSILRTNSQFDEANGGPRNSVNPRRISWAHGMNNGNDEEVQEKKTNRANYKVMDIWKCQEDRATLQRMSSHNKTRGVTRLSGAMMAIQQTFQTMGIAFQKKGTWEEQGSNLPSDCQRVLIELDSRINKKGLERFVSNPNSKAHFFWELFSMLFIAYDIITVPLTVFAVSDNTFMMGMAVFTATFWSINIVRSFFTGFLAQGDVVMTLKDIARHYMRTWLLPDLLITLTEWVDIACHYSSGDEDLLRTLKVFRILQLLRGLKAVRIIKAIEERITRERYSVAFKLVKFFTCILMVNHLIACLWYGIGDAHKGNADNWLEAYLKEEAESLGYCYATSFHWALTQFTPASIEVQPRNALERFFAIIVLLFALVTVSSFISGITGAVMELRNLAAKKSKEFWLLRRYMSESSVPTELALRVQHYLDFAWRMREHRLLEDNVEVLGLLSTALRVQLNTAIFEPRISVHPLFVLIGKMAAFIMQRLCNTAVTRLFSIQGDSLFSVNTKMSKMFVIFSGELEYQLDESGKPEQVKPGVWVCEPALWTEWSTYGALVALTDCEIVSVDATCFGDAVKMADEIWCEAVHYARGFVQGLNRIDKSRLTDLFHSNLIEGLWFRLLNDWNVRSRPTLQNGIDFEGRGSTISIAGNMMAVPGAGLKKVEE